MTPALAGANIIYGLGMLEMGVTLCFKQLLMDADMAAMIKHILAGVPVTDYTLSVDLIRQVGIGKNFLAHKNTFNDRMIQSQPMLIDRTMRGRWEEHGSTAMPDRALAKYHHILETHQVPELPPEIKAGLRRIVTDAEKEWGVLGAGEE